LRFLCLRCLRCFLIRISAPIFIFRYEWRRGLSRCHVTLPVSCATAVTRPCVDSCFLVMRLAGPGAVDLLITGEAGADDLSTGAATQHTTFLGPGHRPDLTVPTHGVAPMSLQAPPWFWHATLLASGGATERSRR